MASTVPCTLQHGGIFVHEVFAEFFVVKKVLKILEVFVNIILEEKIDILT